MTTRDPSSRTSPFETQPVARWIKRGLDIVISVMGLVILSPIFAAIAVAIRLDDGGSVFFSQVRSGQDAAPFRIWKFRTLCASPCQSSRGPEPSLTEGISTDAYTTRTGRFLRAWSLDELPQLWNVMCGDMSLVGPRPTLPEQVARYGPYERNRLAMPPGLTGWAQVHGRNALSWPERIDLDVWYVANWHLALDLKILLKTPLVVLKRTGVQGTNGINPDFRPPDAHRSPSSSSPPPS